MRKEVTFEVEITDDVSDPEIMEWLQFKLGELGGCSMDNPLVDQELEAEFVTFK